MRILFTGSSSFTGYWFIRELVLGGHDVTAIFQGERTSYVEGRRVRVDQLTSLVEPVWRCSFGDKRFLKLLRSESWDLICLHSAHVHNYKSPDFHVADALAANTKEIKSVVETAASRGCGRLLVTGSIFEPGEGAGSEGLPAFSAYGVSKSLTWQVCEYYASMAGMGIGKFVIPNPFGPFEDPRFTAYLVRTWEQGNVAQVQTPDYVRDNIHVTLLALAYRRFAEQLTVKGQLQLNPSGYVESQGQFATRFAREMRVRTDYECELDFLAQLEFPEPRVRINTDPIDGRELSWSETDAWDQIAEHYF